MKKIVLVVGFFLIGFVCFGAKVDLAVSNSDVSIIPSSPTTTDNVQVKIKVHNYGSKDSKSCSIKLKITLGTEKVFNQKGSLPPISPNSYYEATFNVGTLKEGSYTLLIKVDPANAIPETNESNNRVTTSMNVVKGGQSGQEGKVVSSIVGNTFQTMLYGGGLVGNLPGSSIKNTFGKALEIVREFTQSNRSEETLSCGKSGYMDFSYTLDNTYLRPKTITLMYYNCEEYTNDAHTEYMRVNGRLYIEITYLSDNISSPDFYKISNLLIKAGDGTPSSDTYPDYQMIYFVNGQMIDEIKEDFTMNAAIIAYSGDEPTDFGVYLDGTMEYKSYQESFGYSTTYENLHIDMHYEGNDYESLIEGVLAGSCTVVYNGEISTKVKVTYYNVNLTSHDTPSLREDTITGLMEVVAPCFSGQFSVQTIHPITTYGDDGCPKSGELLVTTANTSITIKYNSDYTITVDVGSDGTVDYTFRTCMVLLDYPCK